LSNTAQDLLLFKLKLKNLRLRFSTQLEAYLLKEGVINFVSLAD